MLDKIPTYGILKLLSGIYFQNMCIVTCDFRRKNRLIALLFTRFGIAVPVFNYQKHPTWSSLYQNVAYQIIQNYLIP